jgi:hypothetical protein
MDGTKSILFTFDYELFLGPKSGTVNDCMVKPTNKLMHLFDEHKIKNAIFFVDTTYLLRLKAQTNEACKADFILVQNQLRELVRKGHDVFPHIHPHWMDAVYIENINEWSLKDYSKYRFHNVDSKTQWELFDGSIDLLYSIISPVNPDYKIVGYRAGGWSIQPFEDFKPLFIKHNIKNEFSVLKGFKNLSKAQYYDFRNAPVEDVYHFSDDVCSRNKNGEFTEYCISTFPVSKSIYYANKAFAKYLWQRGYRSGGKGQGISLREEGTEERNDIEMVSIELLNRIKLPAYKKHLKKYNFMQFISHPKMLSEHNLKCFGEFLDHCLKKYKLVNDFRKIKITG